MLLLILVAFGVLGINNCDFNTGSVVVLLEITSQTVAKTQSKKNTATAIFVQPGFTVFDPPKDGNCQFAAVAHLLRHHLHLTLSPEDVRADAIRYLSHNIHCHNDHVTANQTHLSTQHVPSRNFWRSRHARRHVMCVQGAVCCAIYAW